jgi:SAM-dependent methyltransferase
MIDKLKVVKNSQSRKPKTASKNSVYLDANFYQIGKSLESARLYLKYLCGIFQPKSVLDVGCGRGAWLKACHELGATRLLGFDGEWNTKSLMIDDAIEFQGIDLSKPFFVPEKVDLTISVEVAEHLEPKVAPQFVRCLTECSDMILFSAAYLNQGGTNHINEQQHSYWAKLFAAHDFYPFDLFRPIFWGNEDIAYWYRQNVFLYIRKNSSAWQLIVNSGHKNMADINFMNCIHPDALGFSSHLVALFPSFIQAIRKRLFTVKGKKNNYAELDQGRRQSTQK